MAKVVAGDEPVYRIVGGGHPPQQVNVGMPGSTPGSLFVQNPAGMEQMQQVAGVALTHPESIPAMPTMLTLIDSYATRLPWWLVLVAGAGAGWWLSGYLAKRKATASVVAAGE